MGEDPAGKIFNTIEANGTGIGAHALCFVGAIFNQ
jgi:hypothetical protein